MSIELTCWCQLDGFEIERSFTGITGIRKMLKKKTKQVLSIAPRLFRSIFDVEFTYVFLILLSTVNTFFVFCYQTVTTCDQSCRQCSWLSNISHVLIRTNCNNKFIHSNFQWLTQSWFLISLPCRRAVHTAARRCTGIIGNGKGTTHMRAVGVNEQAAGGTWGQGLPAAGLSVLAGQHHACQREFSVPSGAGACACSWSAPVPGAGKCQDLPGLQTPRSPAVYMNLL